MLTTAYQSKGLDVTSMTMSVETQPEEGTRHSMALNSFLGFPGLTK